jgi:hypothetical protein
MSASATEPLLQEIGDGTLYLGGSGQGYEVLQRCPVARANRPGPKARIDTAYICRFDGTDFFQWTGRKADGYFHPFGKIMRLTDAGRAALAAKQAADSQGPPAPRSGATPSPK